MKRDIVERLGVSAASVFVVPNGCSADKVPPEGLPEGLRPGYLLFVGTFEPRKNLERVLAAYRSLRSDRDDLPELVVVGGRGWRGADELRRRAEDTPGVVVLGYVDDAVLEGLYRDARMLVFPSLYEGFGLPIIEAMAAGTPVLTSRVGALEEVADGAGMLVDPTDPGDIARGMTKLLDDADLAGRLVDAGRKVAAGYTWDRAGAALREAIEALATHR
jgi:alpha-1,3-rhamnosyl/mannosyltransferase